MLQTNKKRRIGWDLMRVLMTMTIFAFHFQGHVKLKFYIFDKYVSVGALCMTGFFMLSGAVTYYSRICKGNSVTKEWVFCSNRLLGLLPLYWIFLVWHIFHNYFSRKLLVMIPAELLGIQTFFFEVTAQPPNGGVWFISCLVIDIALFPYIYTVIKEFNKKYLFIFLIFLIFLDIYSVFVTADLGFGELYHSPFIRFVQYSIGCTVSALLQKRNTIKSNIFALIWSVILSALFVLIVSTMAHNKLFTQYSYTHRLIAYDIVAVPYFVLMLWLLYDISFCKVFESIITFFNSLTYSFYLAQCMPAYTISLKTFESFGIQENSLRIFVSFAINLFMSISIHFLVELPVVKYIRNWFSKKIDSIGITA